jgi:hypothetical protein
MSSLLTLALVKALALGAPADVCAFSDHHDTDRCGTLVADRAFIPGQQLSADFMLYVGESEEAAEFSICMQTNKGVECLGVVR